MNLPKIICIDFDGTLVEHAYPLIGEPLWPIVARAKLEVENGTKIILHTCRTGKQLSEAVLFCRYALGLEFDAINKNVAEVENSPFYDINNIKPYANEYWDDKAVNVSTLLSLNKHAKETKEYWRVIECLAE